jgi:hypothetical protein
MTLNLMLASPSAVYLSGDFRLTSTSGRFTDNLNTQKLVPVLKLGWFALVSFAGLGRTAAGMDVGDWLAAETAAIDQHAGVDELERRLIGADTWLSALGPARHHIFSAVGFNGAQPFAMAVSNYLDDQGQYLPAVGHMRSRMVATDQPQVLVRGWEPAVLPDEIEALRRALQDDSDPIQLQLRMAAVNEAAAGRSATISRECVTGHLLSNGHGEVSPRGIPDTAEYMPSFVRRQLHGGGVRGFLRKTDGNGRLLPPYWVGMTLQIQNDVFAALHAVRNVEGPPCTNVVQSPLFWENQM